MDPVWIFAFGASRNLFLESFSKSWVQKLVFNENPTFGFLASAFSLKRSQAEAVLWTNWKHRGTLTAVSDVKLAMLDAQGFFDLCQRFMRRSEAALRILGYLVKRCEATFFFLMPREMLSDVVKFR